jgi:hypothetical protein
MGTLMIALALYLAISAWLFGSAFVLPHSDATAWNAMITAVLIAAVALVSFASPGRPGLRFGNALLAVWLLIEAILMPHVAFGTMLHDIFIGMLLSSVVIFTSGRWPRPKGAGQPAG